MSSRWKLIVGGLLVTLGLLLAFLPKEWLEERSLDLDGGNGLAELAIAGVPLIIGVALMVSAFVRRTVSDRATTRSEP